MGGWAWVAKQHGQTINIDELAPKPEPFTLKQWCALFAIILLIFFVIAPAFPGLKDFVPESIIALIANVGSIA